MIIHDYQNWWAGADFSWCVEKSEKSARFELASTREAYKTLAHSHVVRAVAPIIPQFLAIK